ncbi:MULTISPECIES: hypothetical protein [Thermodesulfovibrio]|jgi:hypothetical protein|uniref:hypothetical protein n=1 Tax=Thermodesulfovibrio TaxID=28261 RepID=UPI00260D7466|nr:hypothetical protein [Thermodesulfovibrio sp.]
MLKLAPVSRFITLIQIGIVVFTLLSIFAILWVRSNVIAIEYRLSSLEEQKKELLREQKTLIAERASLTSFVRIENKEYALIFPDRKKVVYITGKPEHLIKSVSYNKTK